MGLKEIEQMQKRIGELERQITDKKVELARLEAEKQNNPQIRDIDATIVGIPTSGLSVENQKLEISKLNAKKTVILQPLNDKKAEIANLEKQLEATQAVLTRAVEEQKDVDRTVKLRAATVTPKKIVEQMQRQHWKARITIHYLKPERYDTRDSRRASAHIELLDDDKLVFECPQVGEEAEQKRFACASDDQGYESLIMRGWVKHPCRNEAGKILSDEYIIGFATKGELLGAMRTTVDCAFWPEEKSPLECYGRCLEELEKMVRAEEQQMDKMQHDFAAQLAELKNKHDEELEALRKTTGAELEVHQHKMEELEKALKESQGMVFVAEQKMREMQTEKSRLEADLQTAQGKAKKTEESLKELNAMRLQSESDKKLQGLCNELEMAKNNIANAQKNERDLRGAISEYKDRSQKLEHDLQQERSTREKIEAELKGRREGDLARLARGEQQARERAEKLRETEADKYQKDLKAAQSHIEELRKERENTERRYNDFQRQMKELQNMRGLLEEKAQNDKQARESLGRVVEQITSQGKVIDEMRNRLLDLTERQYAEREKEMQMLKSIKENLEKASIKDTKLQQELEETNQKIAELTAAVNEVGYKLLSLTQERYTACQSQIRCLEESLSQSGADAAEVKRQIDELAKNSRETKSKLAELEKKIDVEIERKILALQENILKSLDEKMQELEKDNAADRTFLGELRTAQEVEARKTDKRKIFLGAEYPALRDFYLCFQRVMNVALLAAELNGKFESSATSKKEAFATGLKILGRVLPVPVVGAGFSLVGKLIDFWADRKRQKKSERIAKCLPVSTFEREALVEEVAFGLCERYEYQLKNLSVATNYEDVLKRLAEVAVSRIQAYLVYLQSALEKGEDQRQQDKHKEDYARDPVNTVTRAVRIAKFTFKKDGRAGKEMIKFEKNPRIISRPDTPPPTLENWKVSGFFSKPGIRTPSPERKHFALERPPGDKSKGNLYTEVGNYGYATGTEQEATEAGLKFLS